MGEAIQGVALVSLIVIVWWTAFWAVCGIHMANTRHIGRSSAIALCVLLGPFGVVIVDQMHRARRSKDARAEAS
jgi:hypothetical protein